MTKPAPTAAATDAGYWTIQIINQDRSQTGGRYLCHAAGDRQAQSIALLLAGSGRTTVGYDYHRVGQPRASDVLVMGQSQIIDTAEAWTRLSNP